MAAPILLVLCGPSGAGKSTICKILEHQYGWDRLRTVTTNPRESKERNDEHIHLKLQEFEQQIDAAMLAEIMDGYGVYVNDLSDVVQPNTRTIVVLDHDGLEWMHDYFIGADLVLISIFLSTARETASQRLRRHGFSQLSVQRKLADYDMDVLTGLSCDFEIPTDQGLTPWEIGNQIHSTCASLGKQEGIKRKEQH